MSQRYWADKFWKRSVVNCMVMNTFRKKFFIKKDTHKLVLCHCKNSMLRQMPCGHYRLKYFRARFRFCRDIRKFFCLFIRGPDGFESWNKTEVSWHTPFKGTVLPDFCLFLLHWLTTPFGVYCENKASIQPPHLSCWRIKNPPPPPWRGAEGGLHFLSPSPGGLLQGGGEGE